MPDDRKRKQRAAAQARRRDTWRAAGLCQTCGKGPGPNCPPCVVKHNKRAKARAAERKAAGVCYRCKSALTAVCSDAVAYLQCPRCFFRNMAKLHLKDVNRWEELAELFEVQGGVCRFTREPLILGSNASLDHRVPKARGGTDEIGNLQWTTKTVNLCKRDLTDAEFIAMCAGVTRCCAQPRASFL